MFFVRNISIATTLRVQYSKNDLPPTEEAIYFLEDGEEYHIPAFIPDMDYYAEKDLDLYKFNFYEYRNHKQRNTEFLIYPVCTEKSSMFIVLSRLAIKPS